MSENSKIEWCDHTINFWWGCEKVSPACDHCYAETIAKRFHPGIWGRGASRWLNVDSAVEKCLKLNKRAEKAGRIDRVFVNSMSDFFEARYDLDDARLKAFQTFRNCQNLIFMLLTKRPKYAYKWVVRYTNSEFSNVWIGTTVENQKAADKRIPELMKIPVAVRYISVEPMLEEIDLNLSDIGHRSWDGRRLDWVICGGESGNQARPMLASWAYSLWEQCDEANISFFMKQGSMANWEDHKNFNEFPHGLQVREFPL